jgi:L-rhamnose isomerase/sugar isomerase
MSGYGDKDLEKQAQRILDELAAQGRDPESLLERLSSLRIELPSWGFADTGTRFGKFLQPAAAHTTQEKFEDAGEVQRLTGICPSVAVHVLWDFPAGWDPQIAQLASQLGLKIGAINPNLFQDQCYKHGSLTSADPQVRSRALQHCLDSIELGKKAGSSALSLWLADGTNYPGQDDIRGRKRRLRDSLKQIHAALPAEMTMLVEYKPFEPAFYHTDIADWGMAYIFAREAGPQAKVLVDFGHHLPAQNIEQIVAWLLDEGMLGGFHFNDHKYADDDLTFSSIDPYAAFRVFHEIVSASQQADSPIDIAYMIDQSHNLKPKIAAMIQTVTMIHELFAKALLIDHKKLADAQVRGDIVAAESALRDAFFTDTRPLVGYVRSRMGLDPDALAAHDASGYVRKAAQERTAKHGVSGGGSYA